MNFEYGAGEREEGETATVDAKKQGMDTRSKYKSNIHFKRDQVLQLS